jgi:hypothetical protein
MCSFQTHEQEWGAILILMLYCNFKTKIGNYANGNVHDQYVPCFISSVKLTVFHQGKYGIVTYERWILLRVANLCARTFKGLDGGIVHLQNKVLDGGFAPNPEANTFRQFQLWCISSPCVYHL